MGPPAPPSVAGASPRPSSPVSDPSTRVSLKPENNEQFWGEAQSFKTQEEALRFVMECQPFDYQPLRQEHEFEPEPFPRWESGREAFEWIMAHMSPLPSEFVSNVGDFRRRL